MSIDEAERKQDEFDGVVGALSTYSTKRKEYIEAMNKLLNNAKKFYKRREKIIEGFKNGIFPLSYDKEEEQTRYEEESNFRNENGLIDYKKLERLINLKNRGINDEAFSNSRSGSIAEQIEKVENNPERNEIQVNVIKSGLRDLTEEIKDMSQQEKETENPNKIVDIVKKIF